MIIAFDVDNTLVQMTVIKDVLENHGLSFTGDDYPVQWIIDEMNIPDFIKADINKAFRDPEIMSSLIPNNHAQTVVSDLVKMGHEVVAITARDENLHGEATRKMINQRFPEIKDIHIVGTNNKSETMNRYNIDILVDDHPDNCLDIIENCSHNPMVVLFTSELSPYNFDFAAIAESYGIKVANSFTDIIQYVEEKEKEGIRNA